MSMPETPSGRASPAPRGTRSRRVLAGTAGVKSLRRGLRGGIVLLATGCATHAIGLIEPEGPTLVTQEGKEYRLVLGPDSRPIAALDGHTVEIDGLRSGRRLRVTDWSVLEGVHGLPTWVGVLERHGGNLGLLDRNSDAYYLVAPEAIDVLTPFVGQVVLLEGFVEGAHVVRVVYYRPLVEDAAP